MRRLGLCLLVAFGLGLAASEVRAEPPQTHEIIYNRPSGFWTSNQPAVGGAYKWRLLGVGVVVSAVTGLLVVRAIRRAR